MPRRKKGNPNPGGRVDDPSPDPSAFHTPFVALKQRVKGEERPAPPERPAAPPPEPPRPSPRPPDDESLFRDAMRGVRRVSREEKVPGGKPPARPPRFSVREELEALASLVDLVAGEGEFEFHHSDEHMDGAVVGLSPKILKKLRKGEFSTQAHLDLHGLTKKEAEYEVVRFIRESFAEGLRCVLVIPGRGLNSPDREPVIRTGLSSWLTRAPLKRLVLAFSSARACDGGYGAFYVLLRRNEGKGRIVTPAEKA